MQLKQKDIDRFWSKVDRSGDGCWEWQSVLTHEGYGRLVIECPGSTRKNRIRKGIPAHRVAWELTNGPIPDGLVACHRCDNRKCVRPGHIFLGTPSDNTQDRIRKGRSAKGERTGYYRHPESYQAFTNSENARKAQKKAALAKRTRAINKKLPKVVAGIRSLIAQGIAPTKRNCYPIPGYSGVIGHYKTHSELVAMAQREIELMDRAA